VVDATSVYWTTEGIGAGDNGIWKLDKPGGQPVRLADTGARKPHALAVDSTHVFWADSSAIACGGDPDRDGILRIQRDGMADPASFEYIDTFCGKAQTLALDTTRVYWARPTNGRVQAKSKAGGASLPSTIFTMAGTIPFGLTVEGTSVYWGEQSAATVMLSSTDGASTNVLGDSDGPPSWLGIDDQSVYWTTAAKLLKHDKGSLGGAGTELHAGLLAPSGLAVDRAGDAVYVIDTGAGDVLKIPKDGSASGPPIVDTADALGGVAVDETFVYWTDTTSGEILRACK
jgi:hypothetical protein